MGKCKDQCKNPAWGGYCSECQQALDPEERAKRIVELTEKIKHLNCNHYGYWAAKKELEYLQMGGA